jgi:hypothetical protein
MITAYHYRFWTILLTATLLAAFPALLFAENTSVSNQIHVSSKSGGNTAQSGEVVTGTAQNSVSVKTIVNGEVVEDFSSQSADAISYTKSASTENSSVHTEVQAEVQSQARGDEQNSPDDADAAAEYLDTEASAQSSSTAAAAAASSTPSSFISDLLAKLFAYVSFWISFR